MRIRSVIITTVALAAVAACASIEVTAPPDPPAPTVLLKDVVIPSLPSPYYHFAYDPAGKITAVSFASDLTMYDLKYDGDRISELQNTIGNRDRLEYIYDDAGRVASITYVNVNGEVFTAVFFSYDGRKLTGLERDRRVASGFIIDKTMSFSYYPDGNVQEITEHHPSITGVQDETTTVDRFADYDEKINVDGFDVLHTEFFDHLILLPAVRLQKGNPARVTHTGDGVNYTVDYTYAYDDANRPLRKDGVVTILNGSDAGQIFQTLSLFSYY
jgi:hypothetical protein